MNTILVVLLVLAGVALLLMEMFLLPGFGIAGVSGFACLIGAVVVAWACLGRMAGYITLAACVVLSAVAIWGFLRSKALDKMALDAQIDSHVELASNRLKKEEPAKEEPAKEPVQAAKEDQ
jgi:membrane-bound ClpP family serine protease